MKPFGTGHEDLIHDLAFGMEMCLVSRVQWNPRLSVIVAVNIACLR